MQMVEYIKKILRKLKFNKLKFLRKLLVARRKPRARRPEYLYRWINQSKVSVQKTDGRGFEICGGGEGIRRGDLVYCRMKNPSYKAKVKAYENYPRNKNAKTSNI